jgi:hypothetical protein
MCLYLSTLVIWARLQPSNLFETPVPKIIASDESDHSDPGLEWMLVELVAGHPLRKRWKKFPMRAKENLTKQLVGYQVELCRRNLKEPGTSVKLKRKRLNLRRS